ncbi:Oxidoreductase probably involved in sulfite reduction [plant metagenome]|uniref:Oxidoreductase probably involved in sulfite reduction n=2 Tax=root TaxID=1 RepID=A0A1C3K7Z1_9BURK|nr:DUF934 domain-containing protein [Orrella dioscoreae]SBT27630.1 Oxidoreductase probably involved in sulfite reduction [Orrella dioscoreae]SOE48646.1 Oxidoreductase probably involved in sulfite reduction [Orrella dioscoreae]
MSDVLTQADAATLIRGGALQSNDWRLHAAEEGGALPADEPGWIVSLPDWLAHRDALRARAHPVGVLLAPDADPAVLADADGRIDPQGLAFLAVDFPVYTDGRGYSIAQILRGELGWRGELRATGDVMIDTIYYQARCGFDSFAVKPGHDPQKALDALATFSVVYQDAYPKPQARPVA